MFNRTTGVPSLYPDSSFASFINVPDVYHLYPEFPMDRATMTPVFPPLQHSVTPPSVPTKQEKCYDPRDQTLKFIDGEDDLDFLCEGFKSLRAQMSCGHAVTPTSLTNWCRRLLDQGESRFVCGGPGCSAEWTFAEVCKMALLDPQEKEYFQKTMEFNAARQTLTTKLCPECRSAVTRENGSDLNVLCEVCTAVKGRLFEFCWQCLREWKGARPRKDRCGNHGCCNPSLETLDKCPDITLCQYEYEDDNEDEDDDDVEDEDEDDDDDDDDDEDEDDDDEDEDNDEDENDDDVEDDDDDDDDDEDEDEDDDDDDDDDDECDSGVRVCPSVRACPTCGLLLEHSKKDCPSVVCPRCSVTFCFVCLKRSGKCQMTRCFAAPRQTSIPVWKKK